MQHDTFFFVLRNNLSETKRISGLLKNFPGSQGLTKKTLFEITLCIDEHVTNIISHGYHDSDEHWIKITLSREEKKYIVCIEDDGIPYNPIETAAPALEIPLEERKIGGLGVYLVKHLMDKMEYQRRGNSNVFVMTKNL
jgi:anti-sigma regulatory factor (Ser/Thr protein kinase)